MFSTKVILAAEITWSLSSCTGCQRTAAYQWIHPKLTKALNPNQGPRWTSQLRHYSASDSPDRRNPPISWENVFKSQGKSDVISKNVTVHYCHGLPVITIPLPSRQEYCRFTLKPISHTVADFLSQVQNEDKGIDRLTIKTPDGIRIASSTSIGDLLESDFLLIINDLIYEVASPEKEKLPPNEATSMSDVKNLVFQLYEALNIDQHQLQKEKELLTKIEDYKMQLVPMEMTKDKLAELSTRRTTILSWTGLGLMAVQFGILARLTWWEYSWDIMEPVTYFVTYGTTMAMYAYFVLTKQDYVLPLVKDRQFLLGFYRKAKKHGLDVVRYNELKDSINLAEEELSRLRDPLKINLPPARFDQIAKLYQQDKNSAKKDSFIDIFRKS